ncbi:MAG: phosphoribosylformylglycinamidine synthase [Planctomycetes bacterium SM23_25]|nr:MAG: phosphoribosylformylglycinamidine synthase [Planctomycetes bacterium SM23_25]
MDWQIEVKHRPGAYDAHGQDVLGQIRDLGMAAVAAVETSRLFHLDTAAPKPDVERIARELVTDPVVEAYVLSDGRPAPSDPRPVVIVRRKPGVMDPVANSTLQATADMRIDVLRCATARKYYFTGDVSRGDLQTIARSILANAVIEDVEFEETGESVFRDAPPYEFNLIRVPVRDASDQELLEISKRGGLFLNLGEMKAIQEHYRKAEADPTDVELETLAQTWSEHCVHKTLKGLITFAGETIDNLLASTIARATRELDKPWCVSVFEDNAGVIEFDGPWCVCFKVETHNHPSALEPYGGAATGIGGVIRDPLGTGMGSKPILNTDIFCFAPPDYPAEKLPPSVLHPRRIMRGVVSGVRDYGNRMGIPTANGALYFDDRYLGNPLVYCGNLGLLPRAKCFKHQKAGDVIVVVGGGTGRDGIHGATFSSGELTHTTGDEFSHAVQIGNPIVEKKMVDTLMVARDRGLYSAITDCGAGGLSSSVGEMGAELGAEVAIEKVPLKYDGLTYTEIWISEAQERMTLAVPPEHVDELLDLFASEDVQATVIGKFTDSGRLRLRYKGNLVCDLNMDFLHHGVPRREGTAVWQPPDHPEPDIPPGDDYTDDLLKILGAWNVCSKEWVIRQYDHEVQGQTVIKPLVGVHEDAPGDACVITPILGSPKGLAVGCGMNPKYGDVDPYAMAAAGIDEAVRNVVAVGGRPDRIALLDNFCWGNCDKPDRLGSLVLAAKACYDVAMAFGTPFVSGKDSLNNEYATDEGTIVIPPTLLISAMAIVDDVGRAVTMDLKEAGNPVYLVGLTKDECGGSHWYAEHGAIGRSVPRVDLESAPKIFEAVHACIRAGCVRACHDLSEGGLAVAAAEMAFAADLGLALSLADVPRAGALDDDGRILFSESQTRFLVEVAADRAADFEKRFSGLPCARVGAVTETGRLVVTGVAGGTVIDAPCGRMRSAWKAPLAW